MADESAGRAIDLAIEMGLISPKQGETLREEIFMFPGQNPATIMLRRNMISPEQMQKLDRVRHAHILGAAPAGLFHYKNYALAVLWPCPPSRRSCNRCSRRAADG